MDPNVVLPLLSTVVSFAFATLTFAQWRARRRSFQLVWTVGLLWYGLSAGTEFWGGAFGWSEPLYRLWYLIGALFVAAYLGMGTIYLLSKTRFGYFAAFTIFLGGLFSILSQARLASEGRPADPRDVALVIAFATITALGVGVATYLRRGLGAHVAMAALIVASAVMTLVVMTAPLAAPGYALDPVTHVPVGAAVPGYIRITSGPFNIAGAFCLVFGALFSAYVYMPKRKVMRRRIGIPVVAQIYGAVAVIVNLVASLPRAAIELGAGRLHSRVPATLLIALGGFIPGLTSGLNRFGITWSFYLGELLGVVFIFLGFLVSTEVFATIRLGRLKLARRDEDPLPVA